jgi:hypothetical protein
VIAIVMPPKVPPSPASCSRSTFVARLCQTTRQPLLLGADLDVRPVVLIGAIGGLPASASWAVHRSGSAGGGLPAVLAMGRPTTRATTHLMCRGGHVARDSPSTFPAACRARSRGAEPRSLVL